MYAIGAQSFRLYVLSCFLFIAIYSNILPFFFYYEYIFFSVVLGYCIQHVYIVHNVDTFSSSFNYVHHTNVNNNVNKSYIITYACLQWLRLFAFCAFSKNLNSQQQLISVFRSLHQRIQYHMQHQTNDPMN